MSDQSNTAKPPSVLKDLKTLQRRVDELVAMYRLLGDLFSEGGDPVKRAKYLSYRAILDGQTADLTKDMNGE